MSRTIKLTALQRLGLENLMADQRGKREENRTLYSIRQKVRLSTEERQQFFKPLPNGQQIIDDVALAKSNGFELTLSDDEVRRLIKLGDTIEMPVGIMDWFEPLLVELERPQATA